VRVLGYGVELLLTNVQNLKPYVSPQNLLQQFSSIRMMTYEIIGKPISKITKISKEQKDLLNALGIKEIPPIPIFIKEKLPENQNVV